MESVVVLMWCKKRCELSSFGAEARLCGVRWGDDAEVSNVK